MTENQSKPTNHFLKNPTVELSLEEADELIQLADEARAKGEIPQNPMEWKQNKDTKRIVISVLKEFSKPLGSQRVGLTKDEQNELLALADEADAQGDARYLLKWKRKKDAKWAAQEAEIKILEETGVLINTQEAILSRYEWDEVISMTDEAEAKGEKFNLLEWKAKKVKEEKTLEAKRKLLELIEKEFPGKF